MIRRIDFSLFVGRFAARVVPDPGHDLALVYVREEPGISYRVARVAPVHLMRLACCAASS